MTYPRMNTSLKGDGTYNLTRCKNRKTAQSLQYIVVHYTGTDASAANNCQYFRTGDRQKSADYFIDKDGSIYKFNPDCVNYYSWHCGDGNGSYGITNANSIGIEVVSSGADFNQAQQDSLHALVVAIMNDYQVPAARVVRHFDASRKLCPRPYTGSDSNNAKWYKLHDYITLAKGWYKVSAGKWKYWKGSAWAKSECLKIEGEWYAFGSDCLEKIGKIETKSSTTGKMKL